MDEIEDFESILDEDYEAAYREFCVSNGLPILTELTDYEDFEAIEDEEREESYAEHMESRGLPISHPPSPDESYTLSSTEYDQWASVFAENEVDASFFVATAVRGE